MSQDAAAFACLPAPQGHTVVARGDQNSQLSALGALADTPGFSQGTEAMRAPPARAHVSRWACPRPPQLAAPPLRPSDPPRRADYPDLALGFLEGTQSPDRLPPPGSPPALPRPPLSPYGLGPCVVFLLDHLCPSWDPVPVAGPAPSCSQAAHVSQPPFSASFAAELCPHATEFLLILGGGLITVSITLEALGVLHTLPAHTGQCLVRTPIPLQARHSQARSPGRSL